MEYLAGILPDETAYAEFLGLQNTRFGEWVDSGFGSKKKRDAKAAEEAAKLAAMTTTTTTEINYDGFGLSSGVVADVAPNFNFATPPPDISTLIAANTNTTTVAPRQVPNTNWMAWSVVGIVAVGCGAWLYKHFSGKGKK